MDACSTSCSARPTTSTGCRPARSRAPRWPRTRLRPGEAARQHAEMVCVYEDAGVDVHFIEPDPALPLPGVRPRLEHQRAPGPDRHPVPPVVAAGRIRRGHPLLPGERHPDRRMITAGSLEGGDFMIVEPGVAAIGNGEERTQEPAARQLAGWLEADGWEVRIERIPPHFLHIDVLAACWARSSRRSAWSRPAPDFELAASQRESRSSRSRLADALKLGVNGVCLGGDRVLTSAESKDLNERLRALGLTVYDPELAAFTLGGGGAHCLMQAIRRERVVAPPASGRLGLDHHAQRAQRAVARAAEAAAVIERLPDVVERLRRQALARAARWGSPADTRPATRPPPGPRPRARARPPAARGTPRAASSPARPTAAEARTPRAPRLALLGAQRLDGPRAGPPAAARPSPPASSPMPNTATITFSPASSTFTSSCSRTSRASS